MTLPKDWPTIHTTRVPECEWPPLACRKCGGRVVAIGGRAWCSKPYIDGGCGAYYVLAGSKRTRKGGAK